MPKFCPKCGKGLKPGTQFCAVCGARMRPKPAPKPVQQTVQTIQPVAPPPPPPKSGSGCGVGCAIGCLTIILVTLLILGILIGLVYYFFFLRESEPGSYFDIDPKSKAEKTVKCDDSLSCLEDNLKKCAPAKGEADMGDFARAEFEILGLNSGSDSCVVYVKITEVKELPQGLDVIPNFILEGLFENLSLECLIPERVYNKGIDQVGDYVGENMYEACKGPLFDLAEKFGVDLEELE